MPALTVINIGSPCLHTGNQSFSLYWTDKYQFLISTLLWTIVLPVSCMLLSIFLKDQGRLICYPILIANLIFGFITIFMSLYIILLTILYGESHELKYLYISHFGALLFGLITSNIYREFFDKRDILRKSV